VIISPRCLFFSTIENNFLLESQSIIKLTINKKKIIKSNWSVINLVDYKEVIGWMLGASIAVVWISFAFLGAGNMMFLVVAISLTIMLGTASGGLTAVSQKKSDSKEVVGWMLGASIAVVWMSFAMLGLLGFSIFLVVAISLTIILGTLSGGFISLSKKNTK
jgi:hypothetical protein